MHYRSIYLPHSHVCKQCYILSAIARLPLIECSLQEAPTYLSKGRTVVCPVVPELASSFNWCGSQNLVVSVALSSSYVRFVPTSPVTQCSIFYRRQVCSSVSLFEGVFDVTSTCFHGENSVDQSMVVQRGQKCQRIFTRVSPEGTSISTHFHKGQYNLHKCVNSVSGSTHTIDPCENVLTYLSPLD